MAIRVEASIRCSLKVRAGSDSCPFISVLTANVNPSNQRECLILVPGCTNRPHQVS